MHFTVEATITRQWFPKGSCPKVQSYPGKNSVAYSGFIIPETGELFMDKPHWFNYETTIESIRQFVSSYKPDGKRKLYLVMDNAPWHKKARRLIESEDAYADIREAVTIIPLPPYSPDLNPIEQVWRITRKEKTHNRYWSSVSTLSEVLDGWFGLFSRPNKKLKTLCTFA